jgi:hypothetical protein
MTAHKVLFGSNILEDNSRGIMNKKELLYNNDIGAPAEKQN